MSNLVVLSGVAPVAFWYLWYASVARRTKLEPKDYHPAEHFKSKMVTGRTGINNACRVAQDRGRAVCNGLINSPEGTCWHSLRDRPNNCVRTTESKKTQASSRIVELANELRLVDAAC